MDQAPTELPTLDLLVPAIFDELRAMAHRQLAREHGPITLQTTELVHGAYLRLAGDARITRLGQAYFYAAAARAVRQVDLRQQAYTFKRGYRVMVQVQGSWFPLYEPNPQPFVPDIFTAGAEAYRARVHRVYRTARYPSNVEVDVLP
jgi:ECF sigma factor